MKQQDRQAALALAIGGVSSEPSQLNDSDVGKLNDRLLQFDEGSGQFTLQSRFLLSFGAIDLIRLCGGIPASLSDPDDKIPSQLPLCPTETARLVSPAAAIQIEQLLADSGDETWLNCIFQIVADSGCVLVPRLIPRVLGMARTERLREAAKPILGSRGAWLAQWNSSWSWARSGVLLEPSFSSTAEMASLEAIWLEGSLPDRMKLLEVCCQRDRALAKRWLQQVWATEKAEVREKLIRLFVNNLQPEDQQFLESLLSDRSQAVRHVVVGALSLIENSTTAQAIQQAGQSFLELSSDGRLMNVQLPAEYAAEWDRLAIAKTPPQSIGAKAFWAGQFLERIVPTAWERKFNQQPELLIEAALANKEDGVFIIGAWMQATCLHRSEGWVNAMGRLWMRLITNRGLSKKIAEMADTSAARELIQLLPIELVQSAIECLMAADDRWSTVGSMLPRLKRPWASELSQRLIDAIQIHLEKGTQKPLVGQNLLLSAAVGITLADLQGFVLKRPTTVGSDYFARSFDQEIDRFEQLIALKKELFDG